MRPIHLIASLVLALSPVLPSRAAEPVPAAGPEVAIDLLPADAQWEVRYALPAPATALRFVRVDREGHRAARWTPVDPAFAIALEGDEEVVRRRDGKSFDHAAFRMLPRYVALEKDYAPFSPFGDGGLLVHTGRFHACIDRCAGGERFRVSLQPPAGAHAIVDGRVVAAVRIDDGDAGTNVYVGSAEPVATKDVVAVVDRAFPQATRARLESLLPRLMAFYGGEFGALQERPMLYASHGADYDGSGYGMQGGTLPGQVFMHMYGSIPESAAPAFAGRLDWFFAHEAAHLYQHYPELEDTGDSWIHEGGADAMAAIALQSLGIVDEVALEAKLQASVEACAKGIAGHPLAVAHEHGAFDAFYACGFVMQMAVEAGARRASHGQCGLACVWRDFQRRVAAGAPWNTDTFVAVAADRTDADTVRFLRDAAGTVPAQPAAFLREGLARAGRPLPPPAPVAAAAPR